ncbi:hypothetical protein [Methylocystis bryophila]|uniref:PIN domain-containing protein n=1 Tax=Methylocystis bryophila TaxID=655015 RepID=A0A1W6MXY8_9HYPH|nr:hypothetical protein [Methylocystis bryophila]ARN82462.1 hypothetical protein B1812_16770 [Methylocystis bryophila]BDV38651.1 hypothetical protein DSM21852_19040 [Methylocystis bryophila]
MLSAICLGAAVSASFDAFEGRQTVHRQAYCYRMERGAGRQRADSEKHVDDAGLTTTAREHGFVIVTRNAKDFAGRGVALLDPLKLVRPQG